MFTHTQETIGLLMEAHTKMQAYGAEMNSVADKSNRLSALKANIDEALYNQDEAAYNTAVTALTTEIDLLR